jgi:RNA polymerase sigma-70 factor (ECF subfamily)
LVSRITDVRSGGGAYEALDDRMLVLDFQAGDPEAFVEIHRRYGGLARHVCRRLLPNPHDSEEAFQETMIRVFQGLYRFNGRYALQPWVARIATNVSLDALRARARRPIAEDAPLEDLDRADDAEGPEELYERLVERDLVISVLLGLPETHRRALVLRELQGASHKEIAEDMGITPAQAKALIHRAKGSFRRTWMEKVVDRTAFGFALAPILWVLNASHALKRFVDRAGVAAQAATPELVSTTTSTASSGATSSIAEKVVAAGVTLIVAGGVTVGAASIAKHQSERPPVSVAAAAPPLAPPTTETTTKDPAESLPFQAAKEARASQVPGGKPTAKVKPAVAPRTEPTISPSPIAVVDPSPSPSPSPSPVPVIPPAPDWTGSFAVDWTSTDTCDCGPGVNLGTSQSDGSLLDDSGTLSATQDFSGAAVDAEGDAAWGLDAEIDASLTLDGGTLDLPFTLHREGVDTRFRATADDVQVSGDLASGTPLTYTFTGEYSSVGSAGDAPIPNDGTFTATVSVWLDGTTVTSAEFQLEQ